MMTKFFILKLLLLTGCLLALAQSSWASEPIAIIVNKDNPLTDISSNKLVQVYKGRVSVWSHGEKVIMVNRPHTKEIRSQFYKVILKSKPTQNFFRQGSPVPVKMMVQRSGRATVKFVSKVPGAIGYVYLKDVNKEVKILTVDNISPKSEDYKIK